MPSHTEAERRKKKKGSGHQSGHTSSTRKCPPGMTFKNGRCVKKDTKKK